MKDRIIEITVFITAVLIAALVFRAYNVHEEVTSRNEETKSRLLLGKIQVNEIKKESIKQEIKSIDSNINQSEKAHEKIKSKPKPIFLITASIEQLDSFWSTYKSPDYK